MKRCLRESSRDSSSEQDVVLRSLSQLVISDTDIELKSHISRHRGSRAAGGECPQASPRNLFSTFVLDLNCQQHASIPWSPPFSPSLRRANIPSLDINAAVLPIARLLSARGGSCNYSKTPFTLSPPAMVTQSSLDTRSVIQFVREHLDRQVKLMRVAVASCLYSVRPISALPPSPAVPLLLRTQAI